jgi:hypothetical protein
MKFSNVLFGAMFALLTAAFLYIWVSSHSNVENKMTPLSDNLYIRVKEINLEVMCKSLMYRDTVSYEMENDIVTFIPVGDNEYKIVSEHALHPIGIFTEDDSVNLLAWITAYPLPADEVKYANLYYHEIISEKIWK